MHVADGPIGVMAQGIHGFDGHHRAFKGAHAVKRERHDEKAQDRIVAQFVPRAGQRHHAIDHSAPARRQQNQREHHAQRLRPIGQGGVVQMVGPGPHVGEDQRPKVDDGQAVAVDRTPGLLGDEVIHHPQKTGGQEKAHGVVPVPPLDHGVLHTGIGRVGLHPARRNRRAVDQVQQGDRDDESPEKPVGHINVAHLARAQRAEKHRRKTDPDQGDQDVNRPLEFRVFLALGVTQGERNRRRHDDRLPAPERERGQFVVEEPHLAGTLRDVIG